jgi:hypothetical protein
MTVCPGSTIPALSKYATIYFTCKSVVGFLKIAYPTSNTSSSSSSSSAPYPDYLSLSFNLKFMC